MRNPYCEEENENNSIQAGHLTKCYTILIVCALAASMVGRAQQTTQIFKFKGSVFQKITVQNSGWYYLKASGGQGGESSNERHPGGVIYAMGGQSGGLTLYMENGRLFYEYNMMIVERYILEAKGRLSAGDHRISVKTEIEKEGYPGRVLVSIDGRNAGGLELKRTVPGIFTASETFDVGTDLGSPVSMRYRAKAPYKFNGIINKIKVDLQ
jgi:hypothetical protein